MSTKRESVRTLLENGAAEPPPEATSEAPGQSGPLDPALQQRATQLVERLSSDPEAEVERYRVYFDDPSLEREDVEQILRAMQLAVESPELFHDLVIADAEPPIPDDFGLGDFVSRLRGYLHIPPGPNQQQRAAINKLRQKYELDDTIPINPNEKIFETFDPGWWPLWDEHAAQESGGWMNLEEFRRHSLERPFVYEAGVPYGDVAVALFSDFGTGYYHSKYIAKQLEAWQFPYAFHLGDVYYAGRDEEFEKRYRQPLANVVKHTGLFSLAENHELYSGGKHYLAYIDELRAGGRTQQQGSYFCVRFPHHQIIGVDVNWNGRQKFVDQASRDWLLQVLQEGGDRTNLLLTGSAPYVWGSDEPRSLLDDFAAFLETGKIHMWFWGDNHYCALFPYDEDHARFVGSCIGHAGYPGKKRRKDEPTFMDADWIETEARFPEWTGLRQDVGNNGWCQATLRSDGGVDLLYLDWLGGKRCEARFVPGPNGLVRQSILEFTGRDQEDGDPHLHRPA